MDIVTGFQTARKTPGWHDRRSGSVGSQNSMTTPIRLMLITGYVNSEWKDVYGNC